MRLRITSPCTEDWDTFAGEGPRRHCAKCDADVRDATGPDGVAVPGVCTRAWRLADGTIVGGALLLALAGCAPHVPPEPVVAPTCAPERAPAGVLEVVVLDGDGLSIPAALVTLNHDYQGTTDGEGRVRWEDLPAGEYAVTVQKQGFSQAKGRAVLGDEGAKLTVELGYSGGDIVLGMVVVDNPVVNDEAVRGLKVGPGMLGKVPR